MLAAPIRGEQRSEECHKTDYLGGWSRSVCPLSRLGSRCLFQDRITARALVLLLALVGITGIISAQERASFLRHGGAVYNVALAPDGKTIASACPDHTVKLWDVAAGSERATLTGHKFGPTAVAFSRDGKTVASLSYAVEAGDSVNIVKWWEATTGKEVETIRIPGGGTNLSLSSDGRLVATKKGYPCPTTKIWDMGTGQQLAALLADKFDVSCVSFASDGQTVATAGTDGAVKIWDLGKNPLLARAQVLALGVGQEKVILKGLEGRLQALALSPDAKLVAAAGLAEPRRAKVWDIATGKELFAVDRVTVYSLAFSPDGKLLAIGDGSDLRLWEVSTSKERGRFKGHKSRIMSLAFSADGKRIVTGSWDRTVKLWDVPAGEK